MIENTHFQAGKSQTQNWTENAGANVKQIIYSTERKMH